MLAFARMSTVVVKIIVTIGREINKLIELLMEINCEEKYLHNAECSVVRINLESCHDRSNSLTHFLIKNIL